jgi:hypothetical protein
MPTWDLYPFDVEGVGHNAFLKMLSHPSAFSIYKSCPSDQRIRYRINGIHQLGSGWPSIAESEVPTTAGERQENKLKVELDSFRVCIVEAEAGEKDGERTKTSCSAI